MIMENSSLDLSCLTQLYHYVRLFDVLRKQEMGKGGWYLSGSKSKQMVEELKKLQISSPDIQASAVVSIDGLIIASALPANVEEDRVSAMSAAMLSLGERIAQELQRGELDQVYIRGASGYVILSSVGEEAVLTVLANSKAKLGLIFLEIKRTAGNLAELI